MLEKHKARCARVRSYEDMLCSDTLEDCRQTNAATSWLNSYIAVRSSRGIRTAGCGCVVLKCSGCHACLQGCQNVCSDTPHLSFPVCQIVDDNRSFINRNVKYLLVNRNVEQLLGCRFALLQ